MMVNGLVKVSSVCLVAVLAGCVPDEDTSPSAALFPTTHFGEVRPDFANHLASRASRHDAELFALFGVCYSDLDKWTLKPVEEALDHGFYANPKNGKRVYRIQSITQAQQLLEGSWSEENWAPDSALANQFKITPNATVALIGEKDQRILFFDQANQLAVVYPEAG